PDLEAVRKEMRTIAAAPHRLSDPDDAFIHEALGGGYLALHLWHEAYVELGIAEAAGLQTPELHAERGRALGELYHRAFEQARHSEGIAWLAPREGELEQMYLLPALDDLEQSRASGEDAILLEGRIALYRRNFAVAEKLVQAVAELQ